MCLKMTKKIDRKFNKPIYLSISLSLAISLPSKSFIGVYVWKLSVSTNLRVNLSIFLTVDSKLLKAPELSL